MKIELKLKSWITSISLNRFVPSQYSARCFVKRLFLMIKQEREISFVSKQFHHRTWTRETGWTLWKLYWKKELRRRIFGREKGLLEAAGNTAFYGQNVECSNEGHSSLFINFLNNKTELNRLLHCIIKAYQYHSCYNFYLLNFALLQYHPIKPVVIEFKTQVKFEFGKIKIAKLVSY